VRLLPVRIRNVWLNKTLKHMSHDMHVVKYREYQAMQNRRRDGLRWDKGSTILLSAGLSLLFFAFVFYDRPITNNTTVFSYLRGLTASTASLEAQKVIPLL